MTTPEDDNERLMAGTLPDDPEVDAELVVDAPRHATKSSSWTHEDEGSIEGLELAEGEAFDDHVLERPDGLPGLATPKLRADDPRLAVPQPQLTRWRRGYVLGGLGVGVALIAAGVAFASNQGPRRVKRDERLELYAHPSGGVPEGIAKLATVGPLQQPGTREEAATAAPDVSLREGDEQPADEAEESYDEQDESSYDEEEMLPDEYYRRGPRARTFADEPEAVDESEALPSMAMKEAKGSVTDSLPRGRSGAPGLQDLDAPSVASAPHIGGGDGRESAAPLDDDERKERFMAKSGALPDLSEPLRDRALCELDAGTPIQAFLETAINTDLPGQGTLKATVTKAVLCGPNHEYVAIPQGATFSGSSDSRVAYGQTRVLFCWHRLYLPKSPRHPLGAKKDIRCVPGAETTGEIGLEGEVDNHWSTLLGGIAISTFMSLGTSVSAGNQTGYAPTIGQQLARGAGQNISMAGDRIAQRELMRKPTVRQGPTSFVLLLNADMELEPFEPL